MRADKDSSGAALWAIPVGLAAVSLLVWIIT
jgi:hypothetical protein